VIDDSARHTRPYGAVNCRVFDALASGALVVSNDAEGVRELFDEEFPVWEDATTLRSQVDAARQDPGWAIGLIERYRTEVLARHTYAHRARQVRDALVESSITTGVPTSLPAHGETPVQDPGEHAQAARNETLAASANYWSRRTSTPDKRLRWGHFPVIRGHISKRIAGKEMFSIPIALLERASARYALELPLERGVSVGSGTCNKEIALAKAGYVANWDCFEISETRIATAEGQAAEHGLLDRINCRREDAFEADCPSYDLVFWSHSLHHMLDIPKALRWSLDHLKPGGLFVMDEFVGPNRFQWTDETLEVASRVRACLDDRHLVVPEDPNRRFPTQMPRPDPRAVADADPTESVASSEILARLAEFMPSADVIHLGGVVYHVALSGVLTNFTDRDDDLLRELLALDAELADKGHSVMAAATYQKPRTVDQPRAPAGARQRGSV
jgi:SAM-dependent methyltransferase